MASLEFPNSTGGLKRPGNLHENDLPIPSKSYNDDIASLEIRLRDTYRRAKAIVQEVQMKAEDLVTLSEKFWAFHSGDLDILPDSATITILTIHWNLCMGTICKHLAERPELRPLVEKLERFDVCGEFMLTEVGHGLDARNIETTATLNPDGSFDLHTPAVSAAKIMPPTSPLIGMPRVAVVFARLVAHGERRSIRPFVVDIHDSNAMAPGVTSRLLPPKPGSKILDHSVTSFNHVRLEPFALLGQLDEPPSVRKEFMNQIERVTVGTLSLSMSNISCLKLSAYILARYSQRRLVAGRKPTERVPIISFSTQHQPVLLALTYASVLKEFAGHAVQLFQNLPANDEARSAVACVFKQTAIHWSQSSLSEMIDRCGWQGLYAHNQIIELFMAQKGNSIAEGDVTVLCIRLVAELMLNRYSLPAPQDTQSPLALYEAGLWSEVTELITALAANGQPFEQLFNTLIMPRCRQLVQATGQRMAYEAAVSSRKISPEMLSLFETTCMMEDAGWYASNTGLSRADILLRNSEATQNLLGRLEELLKEAKVAHFAQAPILSESKWHRFLESLPAFQSAGAEKAEPLMCSGESFMNVTTSLNAMDEHSRPDIADKKILCRL